MKKNKRSLILILSSVVFLLFLCVGTLLTPDTGFSENENRYLQKRPVFTAANVLSGRFEEQSEKYLSDQIIGRNLWVKTMAMTEAGLGVSDINGVYLCTGGRVVKRVTETDFDKARYTQNLTRTQQLKETCQANGTEFKAMLVPTAAYVYQEALPDNAMRFDEDKAFEEARRVLENSLIDLRETMSKAAEGGRDVFFRTDHHWTGYGAFLGYKGFLEASGASENGMTYDMAYEDEKPVVLSDSFYGTLYSKVLLDTLRPDTVETPAAALAGECRVTFTGKSYDSLYFKEYLEKKDKYAVYFGGNYDKVDIETCRETRCGVKDKILIIKDSFANSFVPYLMDDYDKITMVDTRYYRGNIEELAADYDSVLLLYGIDNFAGEKLNFSRAGL